MPRSLDIGSLRTRRDGTVILHEKRGRYLLTRPGAKLAARYYRGDAGGWVIDLIEGDQAQARAFVRTEALAEAAAAAAVRAAPTGLTWYDLAAVITDENKWKIDAIRQGEGVTA